MKRSDLVRGFGDYSGQALCGYFEETLQAGFPSTQMFGLNTDCVVPNTLLYDEEGAAWLVYRFTDHKGSFGLHISTNADGQKLSRPQAVSSEAYAGLVAHRIEGDSHIIDSMMPAKNPFHYRRSLEAIEWREGEIMSLTGVRKCHGKSWFVLDGQGGWGFISYISRVSGTLLGRRVEGFSECAIQFMPPGQSLMAEYAKKCASWLIICNEYENGEYDFCHVGVLADGSRFGMLADQNGPRVSSTNVDFEAYVNADGFPDKMIYLVDGERWIWTPSENPDVGALEHPTSRDRIGVGQREGDTRTPRLSYGWVNFFNDDRLKGFIK